MTKKKPGKTGKAGSRASKLPRESFHMPVELHRAFLTYLQETQPKPDKSEVLRHALSEFLRDKGYWPPPPPESV